MSDVWSSALYQASFGGVEFDCLSTSDSIARSIVEHTYPRRDGADLQDMGASARRTQCRILFWERPAIEGEKATGNHLQRFAAFVEAVNRGKPQAFVHPLTGSYRALAEGLSFDADAEVRDSIEVDVTFVEDTTQPVRFHPGALLVADAGPAAVRVRADKVNGGLADAEIDSDVATDAADTVEDWEEDPDISVRRVNLEVASIASEIDILIDEEELTSDLERFALWRQLQALNFSARRAAAAFKQEQPQIIAITIASAVPLRTLAVEVYGARDAADGYREIMKLNDIDDPTLLLEGTVIRAPSPRTDRQVALRRPG